jgi:holo-ACP synthase CitX
MNDELARNDEHSASIAKAKQSRDRALDFALRDTDPRGGHAVVFVSERAPVDCPHVQGMEALFDLTVLALHEAIKPLRVMGTHEDALGHYHLYSTEGAPRQIKERCVEFDGALPWRALFDIDVYDPSGISVDRAGLGLAPRKCMICGGNAKECKRNRVHSIEEQRKRAHELIARGLCK